MSNYNPDDFDPCYECTGLGDDYYFDEDGNLEPFCPQCPHYDSKNSLAPDINVGRKEEG